MAGQIGGELASMQALKASFDKNSGTAGTLMSEIKGKLDSTDWKGPAADRFRSAWTGEFEPALKKLQAALQEAGTEVQRRHDALQQAGS